MVLKLKADVVVVHPVGRFWTLLAHCNRGEQCAATFRDAEHLATFEFTAVAELMRRFVIASPEERIASRMAPCPPHIAKAWHLGMARRQAAAERLLPTSRITESMQSVKYVFSDSTETWQQMLWENMTEEDQAEAT